MPDDASRTGPTFPVPPARHTNHPVVEEARNPRFMVALIKHYEDCSIPHRQNGRRACKAHKPKTPFMTKLFRDWSSSRAPNRKPRTAGRRAESAPPATGKQPSNSTCVKSAR